MYIKFKLLLWIVVIFVAFYTPSSLSWGEKGTIHAEPLSIDMQMLFEQLDQMMENDSEFQIAIRLTTPIVPGEDVLIVPDKRTGENDVLSRYISNIGEDFICFDTLGGSARFIECVPFTNIASIRYLVE